MFVYLMMVGILNLRDPVKNVKDPFIYPDVAAPITMSALTLAHQ